MNLDKASIVAEIRQEIERLAEALGADVADVADLQSDELIPASGLIDSAALLELIAWFEAHFDCKVGAEDFTVDKLGTMSAMADYLRLRKGVA
jgi:D-alanine--poly(phosphoribitol) ligase subunit 2